MRWLHLTFLLLGGALFAWLVAGVGLEALWRDAARLGWGVAVIVAVEGIADFLHTSAWRRCFREELRPRAVRLWWPHLAGAAINYVTPTATLGGEVVRGTLAPSTVPPAEVTASLAINKLTATLADTVLALAGVGVLLFHLPVSDEWRAIIVAEAALVLLVLWIFVTIQRQGRLAGLVGRRRWLARLLGSERSARVFSLAEDIDSRIAAFHARSTVHLLGSVLLHLMGSGGIGALQLFVFLRVVGAPADPVTVVSVLVVARAIDLVSFFVPARLGAQEAGRMFAMSLVGVDASLGLLFSLVLRLEQVVWTGIGFGAYAAMLWQHRRETRMAEARR